MDLHISSTINQPIYEQIYRQIKAQILSEALHEGEALPSIRSLAKTLRISVITTRRAYEELERAGLVNTVAAKGFFVAKTNVLQIREEHVAQIKLYMHQIDMLAQTCALPRKQLIELFATTIGED